MNILDMVASILSLGVTTTKGYQPPEPDTCVTLYEYIATPPEHSFGRTYIVHNIQVRVRAVEYSAAYNLAEQAVQKLNRYHNGVLSILQSTSILDIGRDSKLRQEYTVNFAVRRL